MTIAAPAQPTIRERLVLQAELGIREQPDVAAYPSPSHVSEAALFRGYLGAGDVLSGRPVPSRPVVPRACACGGLIEPGVEADIEPAVAAHNATSRHLAWRASQEER